MKKYQTPEQKARKALKLLEDVRRDLCGPDDPRPPKPDPSPVITKLASAQVVLQQIIQLLHPATPAKFVVFSPDNIPIRPDPFRSRAAAEKGLRDWLRRFQIQGYYSTAKWEHIALPDLPARCRIEPWDA